MQNGIAISKIWSDDDIDEVRVVVTDGTSAFSTTAYIGNGHLAKLVEELRVFRRHIHGGIKDIRFGEFGPEYANGAFFARLHFQEPGRLFVSTQQQSDFSAFSNRQVASESKMYLVSEPILLDNFITELAGLANDSRDNATLVCA